MGLWDVNTRMSLSLFPGFGLRSLQELLTTRSPFHEIPELRAVISRIKQGPPDRPSDKDTHGRLTNAWWNVCRSCWHRVPSHRPPISDVLRSFSNVSTSSSCNSYL